MSNVVINSYTSFPSGLTYPDSLGTSGNLDVEASVTLDTTNEKLGSGCIDGNGDNCHNDSVDVLGSGSWNKYSFGGWIRPATTAGQYAIVLSANDGNTNNFQAIQTRADGKFQVTCGDNSTQVGLNTAATYSTDTWYLVIVVYDGTESGTDRLKCSVNGSFSGTAGGTPATSYSIGTKTFLFEQANSGQPVFTGLLDGLFFMNTIITQTQINALYASGSGALLPDVITDTTGIKLYFDCESIASSTLTNNAVPT